MKEHKGDLAGDARNRKERNEKTEDGRDWFSDLERSKYEILEKFYMACIL